MGLIQTDHYELLIDHVMINIEDKFFRNLLREKTRVRPNTLYPDRRILAGFNNMG